MGSPTVGSQRRGTQPNQTRKVHAQIAVSGVFDLEAAPVLAHPKKSINLDRAPRRSSHLQTTPGLPAVAASIPWPGAGPQLS